MELKVIKCEGGFCTNKDCSYGTPALSDVTEEDWQIIMAYLMRHDSILDKKLPPFTVAQANQFYEDWRAQAGLPPSPAKFHDSPGQTPGLPEDEDDLQDFLPPDVGLSQATNGQSKLRQLSDSAGEESEMLYTEQHQDLHQGGQDKDEHHVMPRLKDDQPELPQLTGGQKLMSACPRPQMVSLSYDSSLTV